MALVTIPTREQRIEIAVFLLEEAREIAASHPKDDAGAQERIEALRACASFLEPRGDA